MLQPRATFLGSNAAKSTILGFFSHQASATGLKHILFVQRE